MAKNGFYRDTHHALPDSFDDALLEMLINDSENNVELQNLVDMTAQTLFEKPVEMTISASAEQAFLNSYNESKILAFLKSRLFLFISGLVVVGAFLLPYLPSSEQPKGHNSLAAAPLVQKERKTPNENRLPLIDEPAIHSLEVKELPVRKIKEIQSIPYQAIEEPMHIYPVEKVKKDSSYEVLDESRATIIKGTELKTDAYSIDLLRFGLICPYYEGVMGTQYSIMNLPFYIGTPFKEGFEHMQYISAYNAQNPSALTDDLASKPKRRWSKQDEVRRTYFFRNGSKALNIPDALAYHMDMTKKPDSSAMLNYFNEDANLDQIQPFYISKKEVSNNWYAEFLHWVKAYNGYGDMTIEEIYKENLSNKAFRYTFHKVNQEVVDHFGINSVHVQTDTNRWLKDFPYSFNAPMSEYYHKHPAYRNYPVVGVNYWQALAYCDWLTWIWQKSADLQNIPYTIEFDLPYAYERELAAEEVLRQNRYFMPSYQPQDELFCNLMVSRSKDRYLRNSLGVGFASSSRAATEPMNNQSFFFTCPTDQTNYNRDNASAIFNLEGNVSEWCKESYNDGFDRFYEKYLHAIETKTADSPESIRLFRSLHDYYLQTYNHTEGKLVAGANWYDHRMGFRNEDMNDGMWAKAFIHPDSSYSTVGFRFVMRVKLKNEEKIRKKVRTIGHALPLMDYTMVDDESHKSGNIMVKPHGFAFVPMGTLNDGTSVMASFCKTTEVSNFEWMLFLNDLIEYGREEELQKCVPKDNMWAYKMRYETRKDADVWKPDDFMSTVCFPKSCIKKNKLDKLVLTSFAMEPVRGISHEAALLFANWLSDIYKGEYELSTQFRLPLLKEWEWIAHGGTEMEKDYPWGGPYTRNSKGCYLANYRCYVPNNTKDSLDSALPSGKYEPCPVMRFAPNNFGIYDLSGNVAEMLHDSGQIKGGSWNSVAEDLKIKATQRYDGKPSDEVGFRVVVSYLGKKK